jgi:hypothetical protein
MRYKTVKHRALLLAGEGEELTGREVAGVSGDEVKKPGFAIVVTPCFEVVVDTLRRCS